MTIVSAKHGVIEQSPRVITPRDVRREAARRLRAVAPEYTQEERDSWPTQIEQAREIIADPDAPAGFVRALADADDITAESMSQHILAKADAYTNAAAVVFSAQRKLLALDPIPHDYADDTHWSTE